MTLNDLDTRTHDRRRRIARRRNVAVGAVVFFGLMSIASPANALSGYGYDGTNPLTTGCSSSGQPIADYPINRVNDSVRVGTMRVMYSSACGTNWVAVDNWVSGGTALKIIDRAGSTPWFHQGEPDTVTGWSFGMQAYAPGSTCITAEGQISWNGGYATSGSKYIC